MRPRGNKLTHQWVVSQLLRAVVARPFSFRKQLKDPPGLLLKRVLLPEDACPQGLMQLISGSSRMARDGKAAFVARTTTWPRLRRTWTKCGVRYIHRRTLSSFLHWPLLCP